MTDPLMRLLENTTRRVARRAYAIGFAAGTIFGAGITYFLTHS